LSKLFSGWLAHPFLIPPALEDWLVHCGSLTRRLKKVCGRFSVEQVKTCIRPANPDEERVLGLRRRQYAYVREVVLHCNGQPVVFAHSVVPLANLRGAWNSVTRLGSRPLGEALFSNHQIQRHPLAYKALRGQHRLRRQTMQAVNIPPSASLLARRSLFSLKGRALMVTEVFLPGIPPAKHDRH
jgi:chorismate--pyruvate lyase